MLVRVGVVEGHKLVCDRVKKTKKFWVENSIVTGVVEEESSSVSLVKHLWAIIWGREETSTVPEDVTLVHCDWRVRQELEI